MSSPTPTRTSTGPTSSPTGVDTGTRKSGRVLETGERGSVCQFSLRSGNIGGTDLFESRGRPPRRLRPYSFLNSRNGPSPLPFFYSFILERGKEGCTTPQRETLREGASLQGVDTQDPLCLDRSFRARTPWEIHRCRGTPSL